MSKSFDPVGTIGVLVVVHTATLGTLRSKLKLMTRESLLASITAQNVAFAGAQVTRYGVRCANRRVLTNLTKWTFIIGITTLILAFSFAGPATTRYTNTSAHRSRAIGKRRRMTT